MSQADIPHFVGLTESAGHEIAEHEIDGPSDRA